jgi:hypothetical protein
MKRIQAPTNEVFIFSSNNAMEPVEKKEEKGRLLPQSAYT